ncbi:MAG: serine/threonine-protein kinase [Prosthecobacter sp.]|uniref:serine/threonine-protein kinase n=1 Tax=Prosthecobacter sp. TaxID=1965333 RepID=UPI0038FD47AB
MNSQPDNDALFGNNVSDLFRGALESPISQPWQPPTPEHLAAMLPQYQIESLIGRGGMGAVYRGQQASLKRAVAIKLLPAEFSANAEFISRFEREAQTLASLSHQGIVAIFDFGQTSEGHLYFVMEFVDGTDLAHLLHAQRLEPDQALDLTMQICEALHYAHSQGVVHRDIKPANVLITRDGRAKLADFGLARPLSAIHTQLTATNAIMGTPDYMAPEQWQGKADHRADIYALGVMLYEMLTGTRPQGAFDLPSIKTHVDARLDEVVVKAMRQEPERRYQRVSELREAVDRIRTTRPPQPAAVPRHPVRAPVPKAPPPQKKRSAFAAIMWAVLILLLLGLGYGAYTLLNHPPKPAPEADTSATVITPPATPPVTKPVPVVPKPEPLPVTPPVVVVTPPPSPMPVPAPAPVPAPPTAESASACIDILKAQAPNSMKWVLAPLDETVPSDIRQNLTLLREDLVDEGKSAKAAAPTTAYSAAWQLCQTLLAALDERDRARVAAGYRDAQAAANQTHTNQALNARRNYMMSWPQYAREGDQRGELQRQSANHTALASEAQKVAWATQGAKLSRSLDTLYARFREAMRQ